jgi:hypothetical protein
MLMDKWLLGNGIGPKGTAVIVGADGALAYTFDGTTFTKITANGGTNLYGVAYGVVSGVGYWVACGSSQSIIYSTDGIFWTSVSSANIPKRNGTITTDAFRSITFGNGVFVIASSGGGLYRAADPTGAWTASFQTMPTSNYIPSFRYVKYFSATSYFVTCGDALVSGATWTGAEPLFVSTDGTTWTNKSRYVGTNNGSASLLRDRFMVSYRAADSSYYLAGTYANISGLTPSFSIGKLNSTFTTYQQDWKTGVNGTSINVLYDDVNDTKWAGETVTSARTSYNLYANTGGGSTFGIFLTLTPGTRTTTVTTGWRNYAYDNISSKLTFVGDNGMIKTGPSTSENDWFNSVTTITISGFTSNCYGIAYKTA